MQSTTPTFYMYELDNWNDAIDVHISEIDKTVEWLQQLPGINPNPGMKADAEKFLDTLLQYRSRKILLLEDIEKLEHYLFENKIAHGKDYVTAKTKERHDEMRLKVYNAEKDYLDLIYKCNSFLADNSN